MSKIFCDGSNCLNMMSFTPEMRKEYVNDSELLVVCSDSCLPKDRDMHSSPFSRIISLDELRAEMNPSPNAQFME